MPDLFGLDIAGIVNDAIESAGGLLDLTLTKVTIGTRTPGNLTGGNQPTSTPYSGKGIVSEYDTEDFKDSLIENGDKRVLILGGSISVVPVVGDTVTIEGKTYTIMGVERDPAAATYECQGRSQ